MSLVTYECREYVGIITINRPRALNALNIDVLNELKSIIQQIDILDTRCLLLTGAGDKAFVAGADISEMRDFTKAEGEKFARLGNTVFLALENLPIPTIAVINGFALGGGCELALSCDLRICSENACFGQPEVGLGITPGFGGTQRLGRVIGMGRAKEMIYTGDVVDAQEAWRVGLVNHVYSQEKLMEKAKKLAGKIAQNAPVAVRNSKEAINRGAGMAVEQAVQVEEELFSACFGSQGQRVGMAGFLNKDRNIVFEKE